MRNYCADLTHAQPLVPETLAQLVRHAGFRDVETRYLHEPDRGDATGPVADDPLRAARLRDHARR